MNIKTEPQFKMKPQVLILLGCLLGIALTAILCIALYFERMKVWKRVDGDDDDGPRHARRRPRWISASNYQTFPRFDFEEDLEAGPDNLPGTTPLAHENTRHPPRHAAPQQQQQQQQQPPTRLPGGQGPSDLPKRPPPRTLYNWQSWDPESGVLGVRYQPRNEEDEGKILEDEETVQRIEEHERRINSPSPYDLDGALARGGSLPVDIPTKRTERPTFPLPQKLTWQKRTPFEKAGSVWWRN